MAIVFLFIFGLFIGSFLNMLIDRLPRGEQIVAGRSHCDFCKHTLSLYDLVPVFSWVFLHGRCRYCSKKIPFRDTLVELITASLFAFVFILYPVRHPDIIEYANLIFSLSIVSLLIAIFFIDLKNYIIPDLLSVSIGLISIFTWFTSATPLPYLNHLLSALSAGGFFLFLVFITKGRGMGMGDVKFAFVMGLLLGYPDIVIALYIAFLTGAVASVMLILQGKKKFGQTVAFGPFLAFSTFIVWMNLIPNAAVRFIMPYLYYW